jgi:hypothetical protein
MGANREMTMYPNEPGFKARETSAIAAAAIAPRASNLRDRVSDVLTGRRMTADEIAADIGRSILAIRPRVSELVHSGDVIDTGERRPNESGHNAIVWTRVSAASAGVV